MRFSPLTPATGAAAAAVGLTLAVAGCSSSARDAAATVTAATTTAGATVASTSASDGTPTTTVTATQHAGGASAVQSSPAAGSAAKIGRCTEGQLTVSGRATSAADEQTYSAQLSFRNKSGTACTLTGYPGAASVDKDGKQRAQAKRVLGAGESKQTITLEPGATARALLDGASTKTGGGMQAGCGDPSITPKLLVTPPDTTTPVPIAVAWPTCYAFTVHPVRLA